MFPEVGAPARSHRTPERLQHAHQLAACALTARLPLQLPSPGHLAPLESDRQAAVLVRSIAYVECPTLRVESLAAAPSSARPQPSDGVHIPRCRIWPKHRGRP